MDEALVFKLKLHKSKPVLNLVSTNFHELSTVTNGNELSMYYVSFDTKNRFIWTSPSPRQYYFKVKDAYVLHGKLVLCRPGKSTQKTLVSLWDIRKGISPTNEGCQKMTIKQPGCILKSRLLPYFSINNNHLEVSAYPDSTCGYFSIKRLAVSIPTFLDLFFSL
ncbi:hypothetical protein G6F56_010816 [Rhizopus delemar]|nr:hypothetical protein G6F56_010816 [Rhizopus delemar]